MSNGGTGGDCSCSASGFTFWCTSDSLPSDHHPAESGLCETGRPPIFRSTCEDGTKRYTYYIDIYRENSITLEYAADGTLTYYEEGGYIASPICGFDKGDRDVGVVGMGKRTSSECSGGCVLCGTDERYPSCDAGESGAGGEGAGGEGAGGEGGAAGASAGG